MSLNNDKKYSVYRHINNKNNKKYIGITCQKPQNRWGKDGNGYKSQSYFWNAIQKYGWNNFKHEILFEHLTKDEACNKEIELIAKYKTMNRTYGYNRSIGGEYSSAGILNNNRSKIVLQYSLDAELIKIYQSAKEAFRKTHVAHSDICKCARGDCDDAGGFQWSYEYNKSNIKPIKNAIIRRSTSRKRPILQYSMDGYFIKEWKSTVDAANELNIDRNNITACCNQTYSSSGGFQWRKKTSSEIKKIINPVNDKDTNIGKANGVRVLQYDKDTKQLVGDYYSIAFASRELHIASTSITKCCKGLVTDFKGYIWEYAENNQKQAS